MRVSDNLNRKTQHFEATRDMKCLEEQFCCLKLPSPNIMRADVPNPVPNHSDPIQLANFLLLDLTEQQNMCKNHHLPPWLTPDPPPPH